MVQFRLAGSEDVPAQRRLWKACFGDSDQMIDLFYTRRYRPEETMLAVEQDTLCAMLTMLPTSVVQGEQRLRLPCFYAVATDPAMQGRGLATQLMEHASAHLKAVDAAVGTILVPATESLFGFYGKRGYQQAFSLRELTLDAGNLSKAPGVGASPITPQEYNALRRDLLAGHIFVDYEDRDIAYQQLLSEFSGGSLLRLEGNGQAGCAAVECYPQGQMMVKELLTAQLTLEQCLSAIAERFPGSSYTLRMPPWQCPQAGTQRPFGMLQWLNFSDASHLWEPEDGYMGFGFD